MTSPGAIIGIACLPINRKMVRRSAPTASADADLACSERREIRNHAVEPNRSKDHREKTKPREDLEWLAVRTAALAIETGRRRVRTSNMGTFESSSFSCARIGAASVDGSPALSTTIVIIDRNCCDAGMNMNG